MSAYRSRDDTEHRDFGSLEPWSLRSPGPGGSCINQKFVLIVRATARVMTCLIRDDRLLISIRNSFFSGSPFGQNSKVKRAQLGVVSGWVTDREVAPGCARVRTKCAEKTSIDM